MKNKIQILVLMAVGIFLFNSCQEDGPMPEMTKGIIPLIEKVATEDLIIFDTDLATFSGAVTVDLYYPDKPKSMDLMVTMNDDPDNSAVVVSNITSWPITHNFTLTELVDLLPGVSTLAEIQTNDFFRFYANITLKDGTFIDGNDPLYAPYSSAIANLPNSSVDVTYPVVCGYVPALAVGSYECDGGAWGSSGNITLTADVADNTKIYVVGLEEIEGLVEDVGPLVMHINPVTFAVIADKSVLVSDVSAWGPYTNLAYEGTGTFNSCDGSYTMKFKITVDQGSFGTYTFKFTRN